MTPEFFEILSFEIAHLSDRGIVKLLGAEQLQQQQ